MPSSNHRSTVRRRRSRYGNPKLSRLSDDELLDMRMCDLDLRIDRTPLAERTAQLERELEAKRIVFRPHYWLSEEWFVPDGVPGIAIPFYLADARLSRLEERQMLEVEGGTEEWCMRILRHEAGHALDNAYRLRRRRRWREVFGKATLPYPDSYCPRPYSRSFVVNIDLWYAQSHPVEDFAETFAVWLKPRSRWRRDYQNWPALRKLEYVDEVLREVREQKPAVVSRRHVEPLRTNRKTLRQHYAEKRERYGLDGSNSYDHDLRRLFSDAPEHASLPSAATFLRRIRPTLRRLVARWTGQYQYTIDQVLSEMIERCRELNLRLDRSPEYAERDALIVLTMHTMNYLQDGEHRIAL